MQAFISKKLHVNQFWTLIFNTFTLKNTVLHACPGSSQMLPLFPILRAERRFHYTISCWIKYVKCLLAFKNFVKVICLCPVWGMGRERYV